MLDLDIVKRKIEEDGKTYELDGKIIDVPGDYKIFKDKGIFYPIYDRGGLITGHEQLSYQPVVVSAILKNYDFETEKIELTFLETGKKIIAEKSELFSNKIIKYANLGLEVNSNNSKIWIDLLSKLAARNRNVLPEKTTINRLGWIDDHTFIPYNMSKFVLDVNESTESWINALQLKGDLSIWINQMAKLRGNYLFRFILAASFSAALLKLTGTRSFVTYLWSKSRGGKTATAYCAMSVWGKAENLKVSFDATRVGIEGLSKIFSDLPILIDEKMIEDDQSKISEIIYMFANGKSKLRGTQSGGVQKNSKWRALAISTGEEPLSSNKSQDGVRTRVLELYGRPIDDEHEASNMYGFTQQHYGYAGHVFVNQLIKTFGDSNYQGVERLFNQIKDEIKKRCSDINYAQLSYIALVTTADALIGQMFFKTDIESSFQMAEKIVSNINMTVSKDVIDNAYDFICDWILSNLSKFDRKKDENDISITELVASSRNSEIYGFLDGEVFYIFPSKFDAKIVQQGFNPDKVKHGFKERGYSISDEDSNTIKVSYKGSEKEFIGIKLKNSIIEREKKLDKIADETFNKTISPESLNL